VVRSAFALVGAVQPAPSHTISGYVHAHGQSLGPPRHGRERSRL